MQGIPELFQSAQEQAPHVGPFMMAAGAVAPRMDKNKVIESVISGLAVGMVVAAAGYFVAMPVLQQEVKQVNAQLAEVKSTVSAVQVKVDGVAERQQRLEGRIDGRLEAERERRGQAKADRQ